MSTIIFLNIIVDDPLFAQRKPIFYKTGDIPFRLMMNNKSAYFDKIENLFDNVEAGALLPPAHIFHVNNKPEDAELISQKFVRS